METNETQAAPVKESPRLKLPKDVAAEKTANESTAAKTAEPKAKAKRGLDPELAVMRDITRKIDALEPDSQARVVSYVVTRYAGPKH